jgi:hypothetical protein
MLPTPREVVTSAKAGASAASSAVIPTKVGGLRRQFFCHPDESRDLCRQFCCHPDESRDLCRQFCCHHRLGMSFMRGISSLIFNPGDDGGAMVLFGFKVV